MHRITHNGLWSRVIPTPPEDIASKLSAEMSWVNPLDFNDTIKLFYTDGWMYGGIYNKVIQALRDADIECEVELKPYTPKFDWKFLWGFRPMQEDAVNAAYANRRGIIKAPPGAGKTVMMSSLIATVGLPTVVIVQNEKPFTQAYNTISKATNISRIGRVGNGFKDVSDVTVMMIQSVAQAIESDPDGPVIQAIANAGMVIVDECHHGVSDMYQKIFKLVGTPLFIIGFSATPHRDDDRHDLLEAYYGPILYEISYGDAIGSGISCPVTVYVEKIPKRKYPEISIPKKKVFEPITETWIEVDDYLPPWKLNKMKRDRYAFIYKDYVIENKERNAMGVAFARKANESGKTCAIIVSRIEHANNIKAMMPEAYIVTSKTDPKLRDELFRKLQNYEVMTVITTLMDEAVDIPSLAVVVLMAGGKSSVKLIQRIRSIRTFSGETSKGYINKKRGYVYYPLDNCDYLASHSYSCSKLLRDLVGQSELNRYIKL